MKYDIDLNVHYEYGRPVVGGRHVLCLSPADLPGEQRVVAMSLDIEPRPAERLRRTDFFGNIVEEVAFRGQLDEMEMRVRARVERRVTQAGLDISAPLERLPAEIAAQRSLDALSPHHFTGPSARVKPDPAMTEYAQALRAKDMSTLNIVRAVGLSLHRDMKFDADATTVDTPPAEAFAARHGVCQDFTHIMIACLRGLGVPAGYVSGFLRTNPPAGEKRLEGADSMHAWVRAWCGADAGWIEFDPTNGIAAADDHIVIARGRDYSDVSPVKGVLRTAGSQKSKHTVDVKPLAD
jgi:transglutaminase-like putative cysteine protease